MTYRNRIISMGAAIGALLIALVLGSIFSLRTRAVATVEHAAFPGMNQNQIAEVQIATPGGAGSSSSSGTASAAGVDLRRGPDGKWAVETGSSAFPADPQQVDSFLSDIAKLQTTRHVTSNPELYSDFGVDDASARVVTMTSADGRTFTLRYGKDEVAGGYVRIGSDPVVYLADKSLNFYVTRKTNAWYDLRMLPHGLRFEDVQTIDYQFSPDISDEQKTLLAGSGATTSTATAPADGNAASSAGASISPEYEKSGYRLVRRTTSSGQNNWFLESDLALPLNQQEVEAVARAAITLSAADFVTAPPAEADTGLAKPAVMVTLIMADGGSYSLHVGSLSGKDVFYASVSGPDTYHSADGGSYLYEVSRWSLQRVFEPLRQLVAAPTGGGSGANASSGASGGSATGN